MRESRTWAIMRKEFSEIKRDPYTLGIALLLPLVILFLFAYALNLDVKNISTGVLDQNKSWQSRDYIQKLTSSGYFSVRYYPENYGELEKLFDQGKIQTALVIPADFARDLVTERPAEVETIVDGTFPPTAKIVMGYVSAINEMYSAKVTAKALERTNNGRQLVQAVNPVARVWYNPSLESKYFIVPGLFAVILMAFPPLLSTLAIVREKEKGSIQQVFVSPVKPYEYILGKTVPYAVVAFAEMLIILLTGVLWFKVPFRGSVPLFLILGIVYVFCTVGIGVLISTLMRSQVAAMILVLVVTVMPALLFSGFIYPIFNMPPFFQAYTYLFPARYFIEIARDILLKGDGLREMAGDIVLLLGYTFSVLALASLRFKKRLD